MIGANRQRQPRLEANWHVASQLFHNGLCSPLIDGYGAPHGTCMVLRHGMAPR